MALMPWEIDAGRVSSTADEEEPERESTTPSSSSSSTPNLTRSFSGSQEERARLAAAAAREAGIPESAVPTMVAIAMAESSGNPYAHNPNASTGDNSYGLWQINMLGDMGPSRRKWFGIDSNEELFDPVTNARAAYKLLQARGNFNDWSVYKRGTHQQFLPLAQQVAGTQSRPADLAVFDDMAAQLGTGMPESLNDGAPPGTVPARRRSETPPQVSAPNAKDFLEGPMASPVQQDRDSVLAALGAVPQPDQNVSMASTFMPFAPEQTSNAPTPYGLFSGSKQEVDFVDLVGNNKPPSQGFAQRQPAVGGGGGSRIQ